MGNPVAELQPLALWKHFADLAEIPRPSKQERRAVEWVKSVADRHGWETATDAAGNIVVRVPATEGRESAPCVVLQSHLDMVCEKNRDVEHDFLRDPILLRIVDGWVHATGTTLGADNGIGVAAALACATDSSMAHGPLELLFTIDEETGLTGAHDLDPSLLTGRTLINLDSEEDGTLFVGCAGGADTRLEIETDRVAPGSGTTAVQVELRGLRGGHSGLNIAENRGNAIKLLTRFLLSAIADGIQVELASLSGGDKPNAIPREADATLHVPAASLARLEELLEQSRRDQQEELQGVDEGVSIAMRPVGPANSVLSVESRDRLLRLLAVVPSGVLAMSRDIPGLVETSSNLAAVGVANGSATVLTSSRGSVTSSRMAVLDSIACAGALAGAEVDRRDGYPGWKPNLDSPILAVAREAYRVIWDSPPDVTAVHAGLECGLLGDKIPGMDMVSFGPTIEGAHSPDERVEIASVERFWRALGLTLDLISRPQR